MAEGRVTGGKPFVTVVLQSVDGSTHPFTVVLDTGFDGELMLPRRVIRRFGFAYRGMRSGILANGSRFETPTYTTEVWWQNQQSIVSVYESESEYLLGMHLLLGQRLTMDAVEGGRIVIEDIPSGAVPA